MAMSFDAPVLMGIVNVTPDSFSDGGNFFDPERAIDHGIRLCEEGAQIVDVGGESTRPGAEPVSIDEEIRRVVPVICALKEHAKCVSIDTRHTKVMEAAIESGANMVNDVCALRDDGAIALVSGKKMPVCLMHMQGMPGTMQENPSYSNVVEEVYSFLESRINACMEGGIDKSHIIVDPGVGFGKSIVHNIDLIRNISRFHDLDVPVLLGASRKSFIEKICPNSSTDKRLPGSIAAAVWGLSKGVQFFRVHDVAETKQAFDVYEAISSLEG